MNEFWLPGDSPFLTRRQLLSGASLAAIMGACGCPGELARAAEGEELDLLSLASRQHACLDMPVIAAGASLEDRLLSPVEAVLLDQEGSALASLATAAAPQATQDSVASENIPSRAEAKAAYKNRWPALPNQTLKVAFTNGIEKLQDGVIDIAREWCKFADLKFDRVPRGSGEHILVRFHRGFGHFSHIGKESKNIAATGQPSMNFAFLDQTTFDLDEKYNQFVILHEFGHALGCIHEHQHPGTQTKFRETDPRVIAYFQKGLGTRDINTIRFNVFRRWNAHDLIKFSQYDPLSIMHYAFPGWMFQDGKERAQNHALSQLDQWFAAIVYPTPDGPKVKEPEPGDGSQPKPKLPPTGESGELELDGSSVAASISPGTSFALRFTLSAAQASKPVTLSTHGTTPVALQLFAAGDRAQEIILNGPGGRAFAYGTYDFTNGVIQTTLPAGSYDLVVSHISPRGGGKFGVSLKSGEQFRRLFAPNVIR